MEYLTVCIVALSVSGLTLVSGFGLGTVLMPAFALFFPVPTAIAATAVVHLLNNIFKLFLLGKKADWDVVRRFALPGAFAAIIGALVLSWFAGSQPLLTYHIGGRAHAITVTKLAIGCLIIIFACIELIPRLHNITFERRYLFQGGLISGFFGGLSGNQGELRSAFLIKAGLSKEAFVGTGAVAAVIVDIARLPVYGISFYDGKTADMAAAWGPVAAATLAAFAGALLGIRLIERMTLKFVRISIGLMLVAAGAGMLTGLL